MMFPLAIAQPYRSLLMFLLGVWLALLIAAFAFPGGLQRSLVMLLGVVGVLAGLYSAFISTSLLGANLENPADTLLHILVGVWALAASWKKESSPAMPGAMPGMPA